MVFKKFADRLMAAGTTAANALRSSGDANDDDVGAIRLASMGFDVERARHALNATNGDVERAAELLLLGAANEENAGGGVEEGEMRMRQRQIRPSGAVDGGGGSGRTTTHVAAHNDEQLRRAMKESLMVEERRRVREAESASLRDVINLTGEVGDGTGVGPPRSTNGTTSATRGPTSTPLATTANDDGDAIAAAERKKAAIVAATRRENPSRLVGGVGGGGGASAGAKIGIGTRTSPLASTHPAIHLPERLCNKSKEEQILRCADRLKSHVMAVDTLHRALSCVRNSPYEPKYRVIDRTNANYVRYVRDRPGAEDMLLAMNYRLDRTRDEMRLERHLVDDALLYLGISSLERTRESEEYVAGRRSRGFHAEMKRVACGSGGVAAALRTGMTEYETSMRLAFMGKCPREPPEGRGTRIEVNLGSESEESIEGGRIVRRFDGDDTLEDVLNWIGGCYGNEILENVRGITRVWCLCDLNNYPILPLDVERHGRKTLQYLGLFPSGRLGVRLSSDSWRDREVGEFEDIHGSARGLGAASRSMLH
jgi:hypothetical protein